MTTARDKYITAFVATPFMTVLQNAEDLSYQTSQYYHQLARSQGDDTEGGKASRLIADQYDAAAKDKRNRRLNLVMCSHTWNQGQMRTETSYEFMCTRCKVTVFK